MLCDPEVIKHPVVKGIDKAYHGMLCAAEGEKLREFIRELSTRITASPYGQNREAWFIGEEDTVGDYGFSKFKIPRRDYPSWIWELGRYLFERTHHPLRGDQFL